MPRRRKPIRNTLPGEAHGGSLLSSSASPHRLRLCPSAAFALVADPMVQEEGVLVEPALVEQGEQTPPPLLAPLTVDVLVDQVEQPSLPVPTPLVEEGVLVEPALVEQGEQTPPPLLAPLMEDVLVDQVEQPSLPIPASLVQHSPPPARRSAALTSARSSTTHCCITKRAIHNWEPYA
ncbi:uncharacterized protein LOC101764099 [Setaria italica]|uniref:uncharacterized protein LOC101764099 n=1 Tax=Setaria italica TaxID=4555 RepID=UPI0003508D8E|nr:uncharacterized protein LOC101764099 [Setaria italica]XP_012698079.1 uncharacterized protein LOC101764099 [Setaria italica]XP_012698080.1 uncharacterized protein LOC101764099 [Setaria italica]XP_022683175.1 uncharacterized protein LOC101764099 [Setaria italica]XP_022683176.1 uncharacterized protein LOC101764099 [Setaria italica]XP_022683179.1 uncharacterized protein LOC101764099 [Setaria italica]